MSGYMHRLEALRDAIGGLWELDGDQWQQMQPYRPELDARIRGLAERLSDEQVRDVAGLLKLVRASP